MQPVPLVRSSVLDPLFAFLDANGVRCDGALELARGRLRGGPSLIPLAVGGAIWEAAARATLLPDLGLRVGAATRVEDVLPVGALVRNARSVGAALAVAVSLGARFNSGERFWTTRCGDDVWLHHRFAPALRQGRRQCSDFVLRLWIALFRTAAGAGWRPTEVRIEGAPPPHAPALADLARAGIRFEQPDTAFAFPRSLLALPLPALSPERSLAAATGKAAGGDLPEAGFAGSARQTVAALLQLGSPHVAAAARAAGTSVRSLQRHLADAHLSFFGLLEEVRCDAALRMLQDPRAKIIEISAELGYTDSANFTRAFRRWTGLSPRAFRRSVVGRELAHPVGHLRPDVHAGLVERGA